MSGPFGIGVGGGFKDAAQEAVDAALKSAAKKNAERVQAATKEAAVKEATERFAKGTTTSLGKEAGSATTDVVRGGIKRVIPKTWWGKLFAGSGLLSVGAGLAGVLAGKNEPSTPTLDTSRINFNPYGSGNINQDVITKYTEDQKKAVEKFYSELPAYNAPGASMYDPISAMANQAGGASIAEMQKLANAAASAGSGIQASGAQGAGAINDIYGGASGQMSDLASYGGEYGAMTPVSGAMATAPAEAQMQGQNLADYLKQSQMITSQDAGFLAGLAPMLGSGYANELAMMDYGARAQAAIRQQQMQQERAYETERARQEAMLQITLEGQGMLADEALRNKQQVRPVTDPITIESWADEYYAYLENGQESLLKADGINTAEDYINRKIAEQYGQ